MEKLLNTTIKHKFPNVVDRIDVKEEELDSFSYLLKVYVIINNYNKIKFEPEIKEYIEQVSKYILNSNYNLVMHFEKSESIDIVIKFLRVIDQNNAIVIGKHSENLLKRYIEIETNLNKIL